MKEFDYSGDSQVMGPVTKAFLAAFGPYQKRGEQVLCKYFKTAEVKNDPEVWYPLSSFLRAMEEFQRQFGPEFMRKIGQAIYSNAVFPPGIDSLEKGLGSVDQAYHMNNKCAGAPDIGHYHWKIESPRQAVMVCDNPFPCSFDLGIIETIAKQFEPQAVVVHDDKKPCRHTGGESCTYIVTW